MPSRYKKRKKSKQEEVTKEPVVKDGDSQAYGLVIKVLGGCTYMVECDDKTERRCFLRKGRRRYLRNINLGDFILISLRDFDDKTGDILEKYNREQIRYLEKIGHIENSTSLLYKAQEPDDSFVFEDI